MGLFYKLLIINPGSTSTKIAIFENDQSVLENSLQHSAEELSIFPTLYDQYQFRKDIILNCLNEHKIDAKTFSAVVGRGGLINPISGGTYAVNENMLRDLRKGVLGEHASNLGGILAHEIAEELGIPSYIVDPVVVDELDDIARISGMPELERRSIFHALNQKSVARRAALELGKPYEELNFIVAHLGGGISVGAHKQGRVVDVNNALDGEGPFTPERSGGLPAGDLIKLCFSGNYTFGEIKKKIKGNGGLTAYLGTNNAVKVEQRIQAGDSFAKSVYQSMAYQISKEIGACAAVLAGNVDAVIITGGMAYSAMLTQWITERVGFIARVIIYPGEGESGALAEGALRVLRGEEKAKEY